MKTDKKTQPNANTLFPGLHISINSELKNVGRTGTAKKTLAAKKILSKVNLPPFLSSVPDKA